MSAAMTEDTVDQLLPSKRGEPAWNIALLYPRQGQWTEAEYLALNTKRLVELVDGCLEVLPVPTLLHQRILKWLFQLLDAWVTAHAIGEVHFAPLRVRLFPGNIREPDLIYLRPERIADLEKPLQGCDLAMEVVSPGTANERRDYEEKRAAYASAGVQEYWIVDPQESRITVLTLDGTSFRVHGEFVPGQQATSLMFPGFAVDVTGVFAAAAGTH
jgi:Uma2 family endonuclease